MEFNCIVLVAQVSDVEHHGFDIKAAILVLKNKDMVALLMSQTVPFEN